jgi:hypothetical protein
MRGQQCESVDFNGKQAMETVFDVGGVSHVRAEITGHNEVGREAVDLDDKQTV